MATDSGDWLVLLAKKPEPGRSKTRLAQDVGTETATRLAEAFLLDTLDLCDDFDARFLIAHAPASGGSWFRERCPTAELIAQPDTTFEERILHALGTAFERGAKRCVILGMDTPQLEASTLANAFRALDAHDVSIGPSEDGGYYLVGLRQLESRLFADVAWSTSAVLTTTLERAQECGLSVLELAPERDVDEVADLEALRRTLERRPGCARRTRALLDSLRSEP